MSKSEIVTRRDEPAPPPSVWLLALRVGVVFGALLGIFFGIVTWLRTSNTGLVGLAWLRGAGAGGVGSALLYALVVRASTPKGKRIESLDHQVVLNVALSSARAFAVAVRALQTLEGTLHDADLTDGTATIETRRKEPLFGIVRLEVALKVKDRGEPGRSDVLLTSHGLSGSFGFGAGRESVEAVARRIEEAIAAGHTAADAIGLEAVPAGAREMLRANGYRVVGLKSLRKDAPAFQVNLLAEGDAAAMALVLLLSRPIAESALRSAAERAGARGATKARAGEGFAIVPLATGESPGKLAARVHQALQGGDTTTRRGMRGARRADEKDPSSTTRMKWPGK